MNQFLQAECNAFCDRFPHQMPLAEKIWLASWAGKHWGRDGAVALSDSMYRTIGSVDELTQVMSAHYAAFGHAAKQLMKGKFWYALKAVSAFSAMLDSAKFLTNLHTTQTKPLSLANLQVLVAVYNGAGKALKKIRLFDEKADDYFAKAFHLAEPQLAKIKTSSNDRVSILLYADMLSNPLVTTDQYRFLRAACNWYVISVWVDSTVKIRCLRALERTEEANKMSEELGLADQVLKST